MTMSLSFGRGRVDVIDRCRRRVVEAIGALPRTIREDIVGLSGRSTR
jgi:hypothetical protein